jgi:hypothetical protein
MSGLVKKCGRRVVSVTVLAVLLGTNFALWAGIYISAGWVLRSISPLVLAAPP